MRLFPITLHILELLLLSEILLNSASIDTKKFEIPEKLDLAYFMLLISLHLLLTRSKSWKRQSIASQVIFVLIYLSCGLRYIFVGDVSHINSGNTVETNISSSASLRYGEICILFPILASFTGISFPVVFLNQVILAVGFCLKFQMCGTPIAMYNYLFDAILLFGVTYALLWNARQHFLNDYSFKMEIKLASKVKLQQSIVEQKGRYIAQVAHDIGTPLATFALAIDLLKSLVTSKEQEEIIDTASCAVELMTITRQEALDHAKSVEGVQLQPKIVETKLLQVLLKCENVMTGYCGAANLPINFFLDWHIPKHIFTDPDMIWNMLVNYLSNARKYSTHGVITAVVYQVAPGLIRVEVIDEGIGIKDQSQKQKLFRPFCQLMSGTTGTGLGLNGVLLKAKALGGRVGMRDSPFSKSGSIFWFEIPFQPSDEASLCEGVQDEQKDKGSLLIIGTPEILRTAYLNTFYKMHFETVDFFDNHEEFCDCFAVHLTKEYKMVLWCFEEGFWHLSEAELTEIMTHAQACWLKGLSTRSMKPTVAFFCDISRYAPAKDVIEEVPRLTSSFLKYPQASHSFGACSERGEQSSARSNASITDAFAANAAPIKRACSHATASFKEMIQKQRTRPKGKRLCALFIRLYHFFFPEVATFSSHCSSINSEPNSPTNKVRPFWRESDTTCKSRLHQPKIPSTATSIGNLIELAPFEPRKSVNAHESQTVRKIKRAVRAININNFIQNPLSENDVMCMVHMIEGNRVGKRTLVETMSSEQNWGLERTGLISCMESVEESIGNDPLYDSKADDPWRTSSPTKAGALSLKRCSLAGSTQDICFEASHSDVLFPFPNNSSPATTPNNWQTQQSSQRGRILLIDDDKTIVKFMTQMLERTTSYSVDTRHNGYDGLIAMQERFYDAVLLDLMMPVMDGMECLRRFRIWEKEEFENRSRTKRQLIVIVSANSHSSHQEMANNAGADAFISKPVKFPGVVDQINALKQKRDAQDEDSFCCKCVLLVDDNLSIVKLTKKKLEKYGYQIETANNGETALHMMCAKKYHAVVLDNQMPIMDGITCLERFRKWEKEKLNETHNLTNETAEFFADELGLVRKQQRIIVLSGETIEGLNSSSALFLLKSANIDELVQAIEAKNSD